MQESWVHSQSRMKYLWVTEGPEDWKGAKESLAGSSALQLEKVLQQGDISECCEPYMVMKEADTAKVGVGELGRVGG